MAVKEINLPFRSRPYQQRFLDAMWSGKKYALLNYHRQSGKDLGFTGGWLIPQALKVIGNYWYCFPGDKEVRRDFWDKKDNHGNPMLGYYIPYELMWGGKPNETKHEFTLINPYHPSRKGSLISLVAVDTVDPDSLRGATLKGVGYSEYAYYGSGKVFSNLQPALRQRENDAWQAILSTPNGHNHYYDTFETNKNNPEWFVETLTIEDTGVFDQAFIDSELRRGETWEKLQQEYYCSFNAFVHGVPFSDEYEYLIREGRITDVPWDPAKLVHHAWDLGKDGTVIWCIQTSGLGYKVIDCIHGSGMNLEYYVEEMRRLPYAWGTCLWPFDGGADSDKHQQYYSNLTRIAFAESLGLTPIVQEKFRKLDSIAAGKRAARMSWFDARKCAKGLHAMREYHYKWDEELKVLSKEPVHDWSSHFMDAWCTFGVGLDDIDDSFTRYDDAEVGYEYAFDVFEA